MSMSHGEDTGAPPGSPEYEELQRGQEAPVTVETLERRLSPQNSGDQNRGTAVPDPGDRPGAVRLDDPSEGSGRSEPAPP